MKIFAASKLLLKIHIGSIGLLAMAILSTNGGGSLLVAISTGFSGIFLAIYSLLAHRRPLIEVIDGSIVIREPLKRTRAVAIADGYEIKKTNLGFSLVHNGQVLLNAAKDDYEVA